MSLTAKQEAFAQAVAGGLNQSDAYRSAYNAGKMKDNSINVNASKVASDAKVALRVRELQSELADKGLWTREQSMQTMVDVICDGGSKAGDRINAVKVLNEMQGFNATWYADRNQSATRAKTSGLSGETAYQRTMRERTAEFSSTLARKTAPTFFETQPQDLDYVTLNSSH